jgi:hypothetical protein
LPTVSGCRNFMVVLSLISCDDRLQIMWCSLYMLAHWAARVCTFVVAPADKRNEMILVISGDGGHHIQYEMVVKVWPWIWIAFNDLLTILAPPIPIIEDVDLTCGLNNHPRLPDSSRGCSHINGTGGGGNSSSNSRCT